jgi:hypothetical protein
LKNRGSSATIYIGIVLGIRACPDKGPSAILKNLKPWTVSAIISRKEDTLMRKASFAAIVALFVLGLVSPLSAQAGLTYEIRSEEPSGEEMLADLVFARPVGIAGLVVGVATSIVALPFALMTCTTGKMYEKLVVEPYTFTFDRPLGERMQ